MRKILILLFASVLAYSQEVRVLYKTIIGGNENFSRLIHNKQNSIYIDSVRILIPHTIDISEDREMLGDYKDYNKEYIKNFRTKEIYSESNISFVRNLVVKELMNFDWKINKDIQKEISGYVCFQATTEYKGRKYIAFYTEEIEIPDGPRKFCGLPGLILEIKEENSKIQIVAKEVDFNSEEYKSKLKMLDAVTWEDALLKAKKRFKKKQKEIEKEFGTKVYIDFSKNLEKYDLND